MPGLYEHHVEEYVIENLETLGYTYTHAADIDPDSANPERLSYHQVILQDRLSNAIQALNPDLPEKAVEHVIRQVTRTEFQDIIQENHRLHNLMTKGVPVETVRGDGTIQGHRARLIDFENQENDWLVVNQLTVLERSNRRPDVVVYLNGIPVVVFELKNPESETATLESAYNQIQTYISQIPTLFRSNAFTVISDGMSARYGTITSPKQRFMRWRTVDGENVIPNDQVDLEIKTIIQGMFNQEYLLDMLRRYILFENEGSQVSKKIAGYHQFHAGRKALQATIRAINDDGRIGVVWHTQGSGKSLLMVFFSGALVQTEELGNPTILVLTDRNDLDNQLHDTFCRCREVFGQDPIQTESTDELREALNRQSGGVVFSTIQKFQPKRDEEAFPHLSDRRNIIVIVDEAHRTQYGLHPKVDTKTGEKKYGFAYHVRQAIPHASFIGFSGTPIELIGKDTTRVFGDYIDIYDISQSEEDKATVPIYYESRLARIELSEEAKKEIDREFQKLTEDIEDPEREKLGSRWAQLEAVAGTDERMDKIVDDILDHYKKRCQATDGKAMIVGMTRNLCVKMYEKIKEKRPEWCTDDDATGVIKVVMSGSSSDPKSFEPHIRSKGEVNNLSNRFTDPDDPLRIVIVRDMWLTGFDAPCLSTMYVDKPMQGHGLMQGIARVNRVFPGKENGLVVDYIGLAHSLQEALKYYTVNDQTRTAIDTGKAIQALMEKLDIVRGLFHGFDYSKAINGTPQERLELLPQAMEHVLQLEPEQSQSKKKEEAKQNPGRKRFMDAMANLTEAFKLAAGTDEAHAVEDEVGFFQAVHTSFRKTDTRNGVTTPIGKDAAIAQLVSESVVSTEIIDILSVAGVKQPELSVLSDEFLAQVQQIPQKNLAVEALRKLLNGQIRSRSRSRNITEQKMFSERLEKTIKQYHNRAVNAVQVIQKLVELAQDMREASKRGEDLGLSDEEVALYDALATNESAVEIMGDKQLAVIATDLLNTIRSNSGVDWWEFRSSRAKMRTAVKRVLRKYGYPPDLEAEAVKGVVKQAEELAAEVSVTTSS